MTLAAPNVHAIGVDFGSIDGNTVDFAKAKAAGCSFVYLKRAQHVYPDTAAELAAKARAAGLVVGMYFFPGWGPRAASVSAQVAAFDKGPGDLIPGVDMPPAIDVERSTAWQTTGWSLAQCATFLGDLVKAYEDRYAASPLIYTSFNQYDSLGRPPLPWASRCPLWVKTAYRLRARQPVDQVAPHEPHAGDTADDPHGYYKIPDAWAGQWLIQQFQGDAVGFPGFNKTVDVDRLHMMRRGDHGAHVTWLQRKIGVSPTGVFDDVTDAAVRSLQRAKSLAVDGIVGAQTFAAAAWSAA